MRVKEEIIGKEVVDISGRLIGKVTDVEVDFETNTLENLVIGKGGILQSLGISKNETVIAHELINLIGDKILLNSEIHQNIE